MMNKMKTLGAAALLALAPLTVSAATVVNGSFEDLGGQALGSDGWEIFDNFPGWVVTPDIEIQTGPSVAGINAQDGSYYAELDTNENSKISQDIYFGTGSYELSFYYSPRVNASPTTTNDLMFGIENLVSSSVNGAPNLAFPHGQWTQVTTQFSVTTAGTYSLFFKGAGADNEPNGCGDCGALIDNVTVAAVPLPAAGLLLAGALGGLGVMRRRKKS